MKNDNEKSALIALARVGIKHNTLVKIKKKGIKLDYLFERDDCINVLKDNGANIAFDNWNNVISAAKEKAEIELEVIKTLGINIIFTDNPAYPKSLFDLKEYPQWLFVRGNLDILSKPSITIVGTRSPSPEGGWLSRYVGENLVDWNVPTVSGLAIGIDQHAHDYTIKAKLPTIAILGTDIYTGTTKHDRIINTGGAVVTEYLPGSPYSPKNLMWRNRIQTALGKVLIPVEWAEKSGTAHTVNFAAELNRPIAGLAMAGWERDRIKLPERINTLGSNSRNIRNTVFTLPREHFEFKNFIRECVYV